MSRKPKSFKVRFFDAFFSFPTSLTLAAPIVIVGIVGGWNSADENLASIMAVVAAVLVALAWAWRNGQPE